MIMLYKFILKQTLADRYDTINMCSKSIKLSFIVEKIMQKDGIKVNLTKPNFALPQ